MRWRWRVWKNFLIRFLSRAFEIDLDEAASANPDDYPHFNAFFTRELKEAARPLDPDGNTIVCPADGVVSQCGAIQDGRIFQAKGHSFTSAELLGGDEDLAKRFDDGRFATIYLSPRDYHRVHMPLSGRLQDTIYIPGRLFSVAPLTVSNIPRLFARNERIAALFDTPAGPLAQILVGAINVSAMETVWQGEVPGERGIRVENWVDQAIQIDRGAEMGRFNMGSTVILLFAPGQIEWDESFTAGTAVRMGQRIGKLID
jgi:phosphatidylserine decarboxylase